MIPRICYNRSQSDKFERSCGTKQAVPVTDGWYDSSDPTFSADGKYLFFVSDRTFNPNCGQTEFNYSYQAREFAGIDDQLDKAIAVIQQEMKSHPVTIPPPPPYPKK